MGGRKSNVFLLVITTGALLIGLMFVHASGRQESDARYSEERKDLVRRLGLTDLCLFTDARYTRHPSMADLNTPFQDYPLSFEHFPSGSVLSLPPHLQKRSQP